MSTAYTIEHGDALSVLQFMPDESVDSVVTDPPYGLSFMSKKWDYDVPGVPFWEAMLRVAKPGAHLAAFGGTRTFHRMACAIEDAGWEIRDTLMWVYGSGFPKSHNGPWGGTALKPAWEPIILARKPLIGTVEANWREHGTGALNIDGCRVGTESTRRHTNHTMRGGNFENHTPSERIDCGSDAGRWPANLIHDGSDDVVARFPHSKSGALTAAQQVNGGFAGTVNAYGKAATGGNGNYEANEGSAARFFYCAKASKADRGADNNHPTVKPTDLMRYLCRLVTPPGGTVLDPFTGSGSTGKAAVLEGFHFIGIEREHEYVEIAKTRIRSAVQATKS